MDDYVSLTITTSWAQLNHVANSIICGVHKVFPTELAWGDDPLFMHKMQKGEDTWDLRKENLGFFCDGCAKTL